MLTPLNFAWGFIPDYKPSFLESLPKGMVEVDLPHNAVDAPSSYIDESSYQKKVTYAKTFDYKGKKSGPESKAVVTLDCRFNKTFRYQDCKAFEIREGKAI